MNQILNLLQIRVTYILEVQVNQGARLGFRGNQSSRPSGKSPLPSQRTLRRGRGCVRQDAPEMLLGETMEYS